MKACRPTTSTHCRASSRPTTTRPSAGSSCTTNPIVNPRLRPEPEQDHHRYGNRRLLASPWAFELIKADQARWRAVNGPHLVALVRAGATFKNGKVVERPNTPDHADAEAA